MSAQACKCGGHLKVIDGMGPPSSISNSYLPSGGLAAQVSANKSTQPQQPPKMSLNDMKQNILAPKQKQPIDTCFSCSKPIDFNQQILQTAQGYLHESCLACGTCHKKLDNTKGFITRGDTFHHPECVAPKCHKCAKSLTTETFVVFDDKSYHPNVSFYTKLSAFCALNVTRSSAKSFSNQTLELFAKNAELCFLQSLLLRMMESGLDSRLIQSLAKK